MSNGIIFNNRILDLVALAVFTAQFIKVIAPVLKFKKPEFSKLFETGGMPSSHSASVTSLCTCIAIVYGMNSVYFAVSCVLAIIIMYDATGIRREAGKHAKALNYIITNNNVSIFETEEFKSFKEFLGHSPFEVTMGAILGIVLTYIFKAYLL